MTTASDPTPELIARTVEFIRSIAAGPESAGTIILFALDQVTMERDGLIRKLARLREANAAMRQALALHNLELDDVSRAGVARLSE
jgi:hypothetical protein